MLFVSQLSLAWQYLGRESMLIHVHPIKFRKNPKVSITSPSVRALLSSPFFFGVRGFVLAFHNILVSSEFGDATHSQTEDDLQLAAAPRPVLSMVLGCLVPGNVGLLGSRLPP